MHQGYNRTTRTGPHHKVSGHLRRLSVTAQLLLCVPALARVNPERSHCFTIPLGLGGCGKGDSGATQGSMWAPSRPPFSKYKNATYSASQAAPGVSAATGGTAARRRTRKSPAPTSSGAGGLSSRSALGGDRQLVSLRLVCEQVASSPRSPGA